MRGRRKGVFLLPYFMIYYNIFILNQQYRVISSKIKCNTNRGMFDDNINDFVDSTNAHRLSLGPWRARPQLSLQVVTPQQPLFRLRSALVPHFGQR